MVRLLSLGESITPRCATSVLSGVGGLRPGDWLTRHAQIAAVDRDHGAGHVARVVGEEERDHVGDLLRRAPAAGRDPRVDLASAPVLERVGHVGLDVAGRDRVDADAAAGELVRQRLRELGDATLRGGVGGDVEAAAGTTSSSRAGRSSRRPCSTIRRAAACASSNTERQVDVDDAIATPRASCSSNALADDRARRCRRARRSGRAARRPPRRRPGRRGRRRVARSAVSTCQPSRRSRSAVAAPMPAAGAGDERDPGSLPLTGCRLSARRAATRSGRRARDRARGRRCGRAAPARAPR